MMSFDDLYPGGSASLETKGYAILKGVLSEDECNQVLEEDLWPFVNNVRQQADEVRSFQGTWPCSEGVMERIESYGAGWVNLRLRDWLAERVYRPLFGTDRLLSSKEGFLLHRPPTTATRETHEEEKRCAINGVTQTLCWGECYTQTQATSSPKYLHALVHLTEQVPYQDGCFSCYPKSFGKVFESVLAQRSPDGDTVPLDDEVIRQLEIQHGLLPKRIYVNRGDVIIWRSDICTALMPPSQDCPRPLALIPCTMIPVSETVQQDSENAETKHLMYPRVDAYRERRTGNFRPDVEHWIAPLPLRAPLRQYFRTSPPLLTQSQAQLYGLLPYDATGEDMNRALKRGVRFAPASLPTQASNQPCEASLELLTATDKNDPNMMGQEKYLGGMASPCGRYVYGVPGGARRVLRIHCASGSMDWIGPSYDGKFKWLRGVEVPPGAMKNDPRYPNGCCVALPCNAACVLKINPHDNEVHTFGQETIQEYEAGGWLYHGGNLVGGWIYAIPANAERVFKFNPLTEESMLIGPRFEGPQKWYGGIVGSDGKIYGIPHNATGVIQINPATDEVRILSQHDGTPLPAMNWKWHGGLRAEGKIYGFPNNSPDILVIDCDASKIYVIDGQGRITAGRHRIEKGNRYKYLGGALTLDSRYAYLFPCDAERVLRIDINTDEIALVGPLLLDGENKFQNGFVGRDGCLYGICQRSNGILRVIPKGDHDSKDHVDFMDLGEELAGCKDKFEGGVLGQDECIYCIPLRARTCVKVIPGPKV